VGSHEESSVPRMPGEPPRTIRLAAARAGHTIDMARQTTISTWRRASCSDVNQP
jgi:hypothetical protein